MWCWQGTAQGAFSTARGSSVSTAGTGHPWQTSSGCGRRLIAGRMASTSPASVRTWMTPATATRCRSTETFALRTGAVMPTAPAARRRNCPGPRRRRRPFCRRRLARRGPPAALPLPPPFRTSWTCRAPRPRPRTSSVATARRRQRLRPRKRSLQHPASERPAFGPRRAAGRRCNQALAAVMAPAVLRRRPGRRPTLWREALCRPLGCSRLGLCRHRLCSRSALASFRT
mmetsp:Transcript_67358/g.217498  ORF Transcript_67358/g.217498 Transcript_67358/m.217498 type:complete len:229 (-) Transcript_67358:202-888(-)